MKQVPSLTLPPGRQLIAGSLFAGLMLNLLPWQGSAQLAHPDFLLLMLLYWVVHQPLRVGLLAAWILGVVMDVANGVLLGQHALAYTLSAYLALTIHRRIQAFTLGPQALHILVLLVVSQSLVLLVHILSGQEFVGGMYFLASPLGALLWPLISVAIHRLRTPRVEPDVPYPAARGGDR